MQTAYQLKAYLYRYKFDFMWYLARKIKNKKFRFMPSLKQAEVRKISQFYDNKDYNETWSFLLSKMSEVSDKPMTFVYCPTVPIIANNTIIFQNPEQDMVDQFEKKCRQYGFGFINLQNDFIQYYKKNNLFPRGFWNSRPSLGHMNAVGHRIMAIAILKDTSDKSR